MKTSHINQDIICIDCKYPIVQIKYMDYYTCYCSNQSCIHHKSIENDKILFIEKNPNFLYIIKDFDCNRYYAIVEMGDTDTDDKTKQYLISMHHCPTNIISSIVDVYDCDADSGSELDSHGIFEYVCTVPYTKDKDKIADYFKLAIKQYNEEGKALD